MTTSVHDLAKLRINRDPPLGVRRAFRWTLILAGVAAGLVAAVVLMVRRGGAVPVQTLVVTPLDAGAAAGGAGTSVTANGYVVARTRAAVSSKVPGRLAYLGVSEGSSVNEGDVLARLENGDYEAQVAEATANLATSHAQQVEVEADRDQQASDAKRLRDIRAQNKQLVSQQEVDGAETRLATAEARVKA